MKKWQKWLSVFLIGFSILLLVLLNKEPEIRSDEAIHSALLDVPLENQNEGIALGNGCEVTALSMLLRYYGYETNKNQLAEMLDYVPVFIDSKTHGDPHDGFVGDITGGLDAMGVAVEPIARVAEAVVADQYQVISQEQTFSDLESLIEQGIPIWTVVTVDFQVPTMDDFMVWQTQNGFIEVTPLCHAAVITGMDEAFIYVNDPYGETNRPVPKEDFQSIYEQLGSQSLYLQEHVTQIS
ncbi:C39 family peptidase [Enterococcus sp. LJL98]